MYETFFMNSLQKGFSSNESMCSTQLQFYGPMKSDLAPFLEVCTLCTNSGDLVN